MSPVKMRVKIAEALGWKWFRSRTGLVALLQVASLDFPEQVEHPSEIDPIAVFSPAYTQSRDACADFEQTLTDEEWLDYVRYLTEPYDKPSYYGHVICANATPLKRCECFLKTKGLWR